MFVHLCMDEIEENLSHVAATVATPRAASEPRIEIVGERRRAHDAAFRARMVAEALKPGVRVRELARGNDICASLIYRWRREARPQVGAASAVQLVAVRVSESGQVGKPPPPRLPAGSVPAEMIEIELADGVRLRVSEQSGTAALRRIVAVLRE
jgi:transposase